MTHAQELDARAPAPGTVTQMKVQKKDVNRMSVFLDGAFAFGVHKDLVLKFNLHQGKHLDVDEQLAIRQADAVMKAKSKALDYLAYKDRTEQEVRRKLEHKDVAAEVIDQVISRLYDLNYLDDASYAEKYATERARRGYGPQRVAHDLRRRGIARMHVTAALEEVFDPQKTLESARRQADRRVRRLARERDISKRKRKLSDFLTRRGFSFETARRVVEETAAREQWT